MSIKTVLALLEGKDTLRVRLILLAQNYIFNSKIDAIKKLPKEKQGEIMGSLSLKLKVHSLFVYLYIEENEIWLENIENADNVYYVLKDKHGKTISINELGTYIKFDPTKPDTYYKKIISQLRAEDAFNKATLEEQFFSMQAGNYHLQFNKGKKAKTPRHQNGLNFHEDMKIYLTCEDEIKTMYATETVIHDDIDEDEKLYIKGALDEAAHKMKLSPNKVKDIYYEVCRRYNLPTLENNPIAEL